MEGVHSTPNSYIGTAEFVAPELLDVTAMTQGKEYDGQVRRTQSFEGHLSDSAFREMRFGQCLLDGAFRPVAAVPLAGAPLGCAFDRTALPLAAKGGSSSDRSSMSVAPCVPFGRARIGNCRFCGQLHLLSVQVVIHRLRCQAVRMLQGTGTSAHDKNVSRMLEGLQHCTTWLA
jgi:hypothetical protein